MSLVVPLPWVVAKATAKNGLVMIRALIICLVTISTCRVLVTRQYVSPNVESLNVAPCSINMSDHLSTVDDVTFPPNERDQSGSVPNSFSIPIDNDNARIPGLFMNEKLYILGARLTTSYDKFDTSVSFDMFGHARGEGSHFGSGLQAMDPSPQLSYKEASEQTMFCRVATASERVRMEFVPTESIDSNTGGAHLIWRCNISPHLSRTEILASEMDYVRVFVFADEESPHVPNSEEPFLTVDIPIDTAVVGHAGPVVKSNSQPPFLKKIAQDGPLGIVLCVTGLKKNAISAMPEFIQHHLNVGVEQIIFGASSLEDMVYFKDKLAYFINQGSVLLEVSLEVDFIRNKGNPVDKEDLLKLRLYNQCLYHTKGISEFLAIWDLDELWMPPLDSYKIHNAISSRTNHRQSKKTQLGNHTDLIDVHILNQELWRQSPYSYAMSLPEAVRLLSGKNGCLDWCFQVFPSYTVLPTIERRHDPTEIEKQGYYGMSAHDSQLDYTWQKPVLRTKYAYQASFHLGGSCRLPALPNRRKDDSSEDYVNSYSTWLKGCPFLEKPSDTLGSMHHYGDLFHLEGRGWEVNASKPDEYTLYMRPTTVRQLENLQDQFKAEALWQ